MSGAPRSVSKGAGGACYPHLIDMEPEPRAHAATERARSTSAAAPTSSLDLRPIETLLARIETQYHPEQVWLFGSRARGDAGPWSDWDLLVVVPDDTGDDQLDLLFLWRLKRGCGVPADVIACRATDFRDACDTVNTLSYVAVNEGVRIDDR